jgi:uncharacterized glyoxalase superfamily protein PhnB
MKFGYTLMFVKDVQKTIEFYEAAFGQRRKFIHENGYGELDTGATTLGFVSLEIAQASGAPFTTALPEGKAPAMEIAFLTDEVPAAYEKALKAGAAAVAPPKQKPWGQTVAYLRDNNGFLVEICTPVKT